MARGTARVIRQQQQRPRPHNLNNLNRDRGYRFQDRDPDMEFICDIIDKQEIAIGDIIEAVLDLSNNTVDISYGTILRWLNGKTRKPSNYYLTWVSRAIGVERQFVENGEVLHTSIPILMEQD